MEAKQTSLINLLERIPQGARLVVEHDQFSSSSHPVGRLCHEAAAALRAALAKQAEPLAIERLRDALVASRIIPPTAVEDPDEYDDGVTLYRIEALHRRLI